MANKIKQLFNQAQGEYHYGRAEHYAKKAGKSKDQAGYTKNLGKMAKHDVKHNDAHLRGYRHDG